MTRADRTDSSPSERSLMKCPDCNKRGVTLRLGREDYFGCRYCDFYTYAGGYDDVDIRNRQRLHDLNPNHPQCPHVEPVQGKVCECIHTCADDPATACSLSGEFHTHPGEPCRVHPDAPCTP